MLLMKESVLSLKEKNTTIVYLHSNYPQVLTYFMTDQFNTIFDDFSI